MIYEKIAEIISDKMDIDADEITMDSTFESLKIELVRYGRNRDGYRRRVRRFR